MSEGNLTVEFSISGSCTEPAPINLTISDAVELENGIIQTIKRTIQIVDCFWIPQDRIIRRSTTSTSPAWTNSYLEFYVHLRTSASNVVDIEFGINGSYTQFPNIEPSSNPNCGKPGMYYTMLS